MKKKLTGSELLRKCANDPEGYLKAVTERNNALRAAGSPWVDAPLKTETGAFNIPTVDESLYWEYVAGLITLHDAACEFCKAGWDNYVDERATMQRFHNIDKQYDKLN